MRQLCTQRVQKPKAANSGKGLFVEISGMIAAAKERVAVAFDGEKKDGEGEEFDCAVQIDAHPAVRFWLRNLAKHHRSFYLPLSHDSFYPDFVGELTDGRLFAVEYKGEHLRNAKDTLEKDAIGRLWAAKSSSKCLYATVFKSDGGLDVKGQLDKIFLK